MRLTGVGWGLTGCLVHRGAEWGVGRMYVLEKEGDAEVAEEVESAEQEDCGQQQEQRLCQQ